MKNVRKTLLRDSRDTKSPYEKKMVLGASGLTSDNCRWVTFDGFGFMMPVGGCFFKDKEDVKRSLAEKMQEETAKFRKLMAQPKKSLLDGGSSNIGSSGGQNKDFYKVRLRQTYDVPVFIPKHQVPIAGDIPADAMKHDYYFNELSQIEKELKPGACVPNMQQIQKAHAAAYSYLKYSNTQNKKSANFTLFGIMPKRYSFEEGLDNISITIGEDGPKTSYTLSTKYRAIPEANLINKMIEGLSYRLYTSSVGGNINSSYRPLTLPTN